MSWPAWRTSRPGIVMSRHRRVAIIALPPRTPWPARMSSPAVTAVSWCSPAAMPAASSAPCIQAMLTRGYDLGLGPGSHVRPADPLALAVVGNAALLAAVDLHLDRDRPAG